MPLSKGTRLGAFEIIAPLGAGGMGEVYRARDSRLGRDVAIKVLPEHLSNDPEFRARFEREAKTISALNHPNICVLHDLGREGAIDYLVMELIDGETLASRLERGALPVAETLRVGAQIADALERAHRAGVIHRDLKPANIMLTRTGAKLMDFGIARATGGATIGNLATTGPAPLTEQGTMVGTFQYMAPELLEGKEADARSDLWALGCVLYEMATGSRAFEGGSKASVIAAIMDREPRPLLELAPVTPATLEHVVRHCLEKDPDARFQDAGDLAFALRMIADGGLSRMAATAGKGSAGPSAPRPTALIVTATLVIAAFLSGRGSIKPTSGSLRVAPVSYGNQDVAPAVSPDGRLIAFSAVRP